MDQTTDPQISQITQTEIQFWNLRNLRNLRMGSGSDGPVYLRPIAPTYRIARVAVLLVSPACRTSEAAPAGKPPGTRTFT